MTPSKSSNQVRRGFTLVEILLYAVLAASTTAVLASLIHTSLRLRSTAEGHITLLEQTQVAELTILRRLETSSDVLEPATGSATRLELASPLPAEHPTVFELSQGELLMRLGTQTPVVLMGQNTTVTEFTVLRLESAPPSLVVTLRAEAGTADFSSSFSYTLRYD